ncbi:MAG: Ig-like domain-containing protein, partial [Streptosporangiaceae bacterium]
MTTGTSINRQGVGVAGVRSERVRRAHPVVVLCGTVALLAGCSSAVEPTAATRSATPSAAPATITITPASGAHHVRPDRTVVVRATGGRLDRVTVTSPDGRDLKGLYNSDRTMWISRWTMSPSAHYTVTAIARGHADEPSRASSTFTTKKPHSTFAPSLGWPSPDGGTVGVGFPLVLDFTEPISRKKAVERALQVKMSDPVEGAWRWVTDDQVVFRPRHYWPSGEKIHLVAHLASVRGAKGMYGAHNLSVRYTVGPRMIVNASAKTHQLKVYRNGKPINHWPVSMGRGGEYKYYTTSGTHLTMNKSNPVWMTSPGIQPGQPGYYHELIYWAVRISNSGEYIHSMPSTVWAQGHVNV